MTANKAIQILKERLSQDLSHSEVDLYKAQLMAFSALGQFVILRQILPIFKDVLLPGEEPE